MVIRLNWLEKIELSRYAWPPWSSVLFIFNYCCTRVLLYATMLKETEKKETRYFLSSLCHWWHFNWGVPSPTGPLLWLRLWFWDKIAPLSSFIKKHLKQTWNNFFSKTWRTRVKSLDGFLKPPRIAWRYYDVDRWSSLLLLAFARVNSKLKKLQHRTRTTYWLCSHCMNHW